MKLLLNMLSFLILQELKSNENDFSFELIKKFVSFLNEKQNSFKLDVFSNSKLGLSKSNLLCDSCHFEWRVGPQTMCLEHERFGTLIGW